MTEETKQKLIEAGREDLIRAHEINQAGWAAINSKGNIVDRREFPEAIPVQKNMLLALPEPRHVPYTRLVISETHSGKWIAITTGPRGVSEDDLLNPVADNYLMQERQEFFGDTREECLGRIYKHFNI